MSKKSIVGILIYHNVQDLDYCGPVEVFSTSRVGEGKEEEDSNDDAERSSSPFSIRLVAQTLDPVTTRAGVRILPNATYEDCGPLDVLLVPGGMGSRTEMHNDATLDFVRRYAATVDILSSVCTGALILASAGLLNDKTVTTHWMSLRRLEEEFPKIAKVDRTRHVIRDGNLFTSAGISAGIDMALAIVQHYHGADAARSTARRMEYPFSDSNERRIAL